MQQSLSIIDTDELCDKLYARVDSRIKELLQNTATAANPEDLLTLDKCAEISGNSKFTWYGITSRKEIPFFRKGKRVFITRADLMAFLRTPNIPKPKKENREHNSIPK